MLETAIQLLEYLGITSLVGFVALYLTFLGLFPELVIDAIVDKSADYPTESKLRIRNNGKITAGSINADATNICMKAGGVIMQDCGAVGGPYVAARLSTGETHEISITPNISIGPGIKVEQFSYTLTLLWSAKFLFLRKRQSKKWKVELKFYDDGYTWNTTII